MIRSFSRVGGGNFLSLKQKVVSGGGSAPLPTYTIEGVQSGTLPGGLDPDTVYYMRDVSGSTFKVALTPGGTAIDIYRIPDQVHIPVQL